MNWEDTSREHTVNSSVQTALNSVLGLLFSLLHQQDPKHPLLGCPKKQKDILCVPTCRYPGWFLSPNSKDVNYFTRRYNLLFPLFVWKNAKHTKDFGIKGNNFQRIIQFLYFARVFGPNWMNRCYCWGPDGRLDTKIDQID